MSNWCGFWVIPKWAFSKQLEQTLLLPSRCETASFWPLWLNVSWSGAGTLGFDFKTFWLHPGAYACCQNGSYLTFNILFLNLALFGTIQSQLKRPSAIFCALVLKLCLRHPTAATCERWWKSHLTISDLIISTFANLSRPFRVASSNFKILVESRSKVEKFLTLSIPFNWSMSRVHLRIHSFKLKYSLI